MGIGSTIIEAADNLGNLITDTLGDLLGGAVHKVANLGSSAIEAAGSVVSAVGGIDIAPPYDTGHIAAGSPQILDEPESQTRGQSPSVDVSPQQGMDVSRAELNDLQPLLTPVLVTAQGRSRGGENDLG